MIINHKIYACVFLILYACVLVASVEPTDGSTENKVESAFVQAWNEAEQQESLSGGIQRRSFVQAESRVSRFRMTHESKRALPQSVKSITQDERVICYRETRELLSRFQHDGMTDDESRGVIEFIVKDDHSEDFAKEVPIAELKNDALESLLASDPMPENLGAIMLAIVDDETQDPDWREYVLQHVVFYYQQRWLHADHVLTTQEQIERVDFQRSLALYLRRKDNGLAGTALIVLKELAQQDPDFDQGVVIVGALRIASDERASLDSRITALAVLGEIAPHQVRDVALGILKDDSHPTTLRLSAMGALQHLAPNDLEVSSRLASLRQSNRKRDRHPVLQRRATELSNERWSD